MYLYVAQDFVGNVYITDEKDSLPPDVTDFHSCFLPDKNSHKRDLNAGDDNATLDIQVEGFSEIITLSRGLANMAEPEWY
jgi:hypothetical protein